MCVAFSTQGGTTTNEPNKPRVKWVSSAKLAASLEEKWAREMAAGCGGEGKSGWGFCRSDCGEGKCRWRRKGFDGLVVERGKEVTGERVKWMKVAPLEWMLWTCIRDRQLYFCIIIRGRVIRGCWRSSVRRDCTISKETTSGGVRECMSRRCKCFRIVALKGKNERLGLSSDEWMWGEMNIQVGGLRGLEWLWVWRKGGKVLLVF